ncbi:MAG: T9SS type A sorting domain-containing protein, partial [Bacteroidota bacterium]|nr:T9SS type A sorting domain-containing protein [Bacteroidota bacterium]
QIIAPYSPSNANSNTVLTWQNAQIPGGVSATFNTSTGVLLAGNNGNGVVTITGNYGAVTGTALVTISGQNVPVVSGTVTGLPGNTISTLFGSITMTGSYSPSNANTGTALTWNPAQQNPLGVASFNQSTGVLTANGGVNGFVTITGVFGGTINAIRVITITGQIVPVTGTTITGTVSGVGYRNIITSAGGSLQMIAPYSPSNANSNTSLTWQAAQIPGGVSATFNTSTGVLLAGNNGNGVVTITGNYGAVTGTALVTISGQNVLATGLTITGASTINTTAGVLVIGVNVSPVGVTNGNVDFSVSPGGIVNIIGGQLNRSTLTISGLTNGTVTISGVTKDGTNITATKVITVSNQPTSISVSSTLSGSTFSINGGNLQMSATVLPGGASQSVNWGVSGSGATISGSGLLQAVTNGVVTITASSVSNPAITGTIVYTISNQTGPFIPVTGITVTGGNTISTSGGSLVLSYAFAPANATSPAVTWAINPSSGIANLIGSGTSITLTGVSNGTITVTATNVATSSISGIKVVTVTGQPIPLVSGTITGLPSNTISTLNGSITLTGSYSPSNANTGTALGWNPSIQNPAGIATFNQSTGVLTANGGTNGLVTITGVFGGTINATTVITISGQIVPVTSTTVTGAGGINTITTAGGSLTMTAPYSPSNANVNTSLTWSANIPSGIASFNTTTGVINAQNNGNGVVTITGSYGTVTGIRLVTISGQFVGIPVTSATVTGLPSNSISTLGGSITLTGTFSPSNANQGTTLGWNAAIQSPAGIASFNTGNGVLTALQSGNGLVTITGTYGGGSIVAVRIITITGQVVPVTSATVNGLGGINIISTAGGSLTMTSVYGPSNANANTALTWSANIPSGIATFNTTTGVLTASDNGNGVVTVVGSYGVVNSIALVTISGQFTGIPATGFNISISGGNAIINASSGLLNFAPVFTPANANLNTNISWSKIDPNSIAGISQFGINGSLQANNNGNGIITLVGTLISGGQTNSVLVTISGQYQAVSSFSIVSGNGSNVISVGGSVLALSANILPSNATNTLVNWSLIDPLGIASISGTSGILKAYDNQNGVVTVIGSLVDNSTTLTSSFVVTISGQTIPIVGLTLTTAGNKLQITSDDGSIAIIPQLFPTNTTQTNVLYTISGVLETNGSNPSGQPIATVDANGIVKALWNGIVTVVGTSQSNSSIQQMLVFTITNQYINAVSISGFIPYTVAQTISGANGGKTITGLSLAPSFVSNPNLEYQVISGSSLITVNGLGHINSLDNGTGNAIVRVRSVSDTNVFRTINIVVVNQSTQITTQLYDIDFNPIDQSQNLMTNNTYQLLSVLAPIELSVDEMKKRMDYQFQPSGVATYDAISNSVVFNSGGTVTILGIYKNNLNLVSKLVYNVVATDLKFSNFTVDGISIVGGSTDTIKWTNINVNYVKIEYIIKDTTYLIADNVAASLGSYVWTIPSLNYNSVTIKISDLNSNANAVSKAFAIETPKIFILNPTTSGIVFIGGSTQNIQWYATKVDSVKIEYFSPLLGKYVLIANKVSSSLGSVNWAIPDQNLSNVNIRFTDIASGISITSVGFNIQKSTSTGISLSNNNCDFDLYPNPANNIINVTGCDIDLIDEIVIYDILGNPVYKASNISGTSISLDLSKLPKGSYSLMLNSQGIRKFKHFILN